MVSKDVRVKSGSLESFVVNLNDPLRTRFVRVIGGVLIYRYFSRRAIFIFVIANRFPTDKPIVNVIVTISIHIRTFVLWYDHADRRSSEVIASKLVL